MVGIGRDLWRSSSPIYPLTQVQLEQITQECVQVDLECLQRRRFHNLSGQPVPGLWNPRSKEVSPHTQTEPPVLQSVPVAPHPITGHHCKESVPTLLTSTLELFINIDELPSHPSFLQAEQTQLSQSLLIRNVL